MIVIVIGCGRVGSALAVRLAGEGHDVRIVMPMYRCVDPQALGLRLTLPEIWVNTPGRHFFSRVFEGGWADAGTVASLLRAAGLAATASADGQLAPPPQRPLS